MKTIDDDVLLDQGFDWFEFNIADTYVTAIFNDDYSGLDDDEEELISDFLSQKMFNVNENHAVSGHWAIKENNDGYEESFFYKCDICGLGADCLTVRFLWKE